MRLPHLALLGGAAALLAAGLWVMLPDQEPADLGVVEVSAAPAPPSSADPRRAFEVAGHAPELSPAEVEDYLARSDALEPMDREALAELLAAVEVSEAAERDRYEAHRELFGERTLERSRRAVHKILVYEGAIAALER